MKKANRPDKLRHFFDIKVEYYIKESRRYPIRDLWKGKVGKDKVRVYIIREGMMKNRYFITYGLLVAGLLSLWGCSKTTNVVAPSTSTITVTALPSTTLSTGSQVTIRAVVMDGANYMNNIGVVFRSSNSAVASFSSTAAVNQTSADTNSSGVATITVYALSAGAADIAADLSTTSSTVSLTVN